MHKFSHTGAAIDHDDLPGDKRGLGEKYDGFINVLWCSGAVQRRPPDKILGNFRGILRKRNRSRGDCVHLDIERRQLDCQV